MADNNNRSTHVENQSAMYSYHEGGGNPQIPEEGAIRRSLGEVNPNGLQNSQNQGSSFQKERSINQNSIVVEIDQSPSKMMFFIIFGIIQIVFIILIANYYEWDEFNKPSQKQYNEEAKYSVQNKYKLFQDINIMIFLGFGFLRTFLKHHSWSSIALTFIGGILSLEFGLFTLICWSSILRKDWYEGIYNFQYLLDACYCAAATIISMGAIFGKLSFPQYFIMIITETVFSTFNYTILRQTLEVIDVGGALTVHLFGAIFGGIFSLVSFYPKRERDRIGRSPHYGRNYNSNIFALFGTLIITTYWPSFNTAIINISNQKYRGILNTYFSIGGSIIGTFLISPLFNNKVLKIEDILNATFAGGIVIAGCCHIITEFWLCIFFGIFAGILSTFLYFLLSKKLEAKGYHDTSGILYYHGIPGFLGGIISTIFVGNLTNWNVEKNEIKYFIGGILNYHDFKYDLSFSRRAGIQFAAIFITICIAGASGFTGGFLIKFCNCNIAIRYFNDSEFFDVSECEPFPWEDEHVILKPIYKDK